MSSGTRRVGEVDVADAESPTPAASAASRARRIGGRPVVDAASTAANAVPAGPAVADPPAGADEPNTDEAKTDEPSAEPVVVVRVPTWLRWAPAAVLTACAVAMAVVLAVSAHGVWYARPAAATLRDQVLATAKTCLVATNTYSYTSIAADEAKGAACTTGEQTTRYRSAMERIVKPSATKLAASQSVQINAAGVESISDAGGQWTLVLYGQTRITQKRATPRIDPFSAVVRMDHVGDRWLISSINLITSPST